MHRPVLACLLVIMLGGAGAAQVDPDPFNDPRGTRVGDRIEQLADSGALGTKGDGRISIALPDIPALTGVTLYTAFVDYGMSGILNISNDRQVTVPLTTAAAIDRLVQHNGISGLNRPGDRMGDGNSN